MARPKDQLMRNLKRTQETLTASLRRVAKKQKRLRHDQSAMNLLITSLEQPQKAFIFDPVLLESVEDYLSPDYHIQTQNLHFPHGRVYYRQASLKEYLDLDFTFYTPTADSEDVCLLLPKVQWTKFKSVLAAQKESEAECARCGQRDEVPFCAYSNRHVFPKREED